MTYDRHRPYPTWANTTLGEVLPIHYGQSLPKKRRALGSVPVYGSSGIVGDHDNALTGGPTLIIGRKGNVGAAYYSPVCCWPIDTVYFTEATASTNLLFWAYRLNSLGLGSLDRSTAVPGLNRDDYNAVEVVVPPIQEQGRIVEAIESYLTRLDAAVASLDRVKATLQRYKASVLRAAVEGRLVPIEAELAMKEGREYEPASVLLQRILKERRRRWEEAGSGGVYKEPTPPGRDLPELPPGWCWATWTQLGFAQNGRAFPSREYQEDGIRLLRPGNLHVSGRVEWNLKNTKHLPDKWSGEFPSFVVGPGELVMNLSERQ